MVDCGTHLDTHNSTDYAYRSQHQHCYPHSDVSWHVVQPRLQGGTCNNGDVIIGA